LYNHYDSNIIDNLLEISESDELKNSIKDTLNDIKGPCGIIGIDKNYNIYYGKILRECIYVM
jgi:hypothetical protein